MSVRCSAPKAGLISLDPCCPVLALVADMCVHVPVCAAVSRAFSCLSDAQKRAAYDRYGEETPGMSGRANGAGPGHPFANQEFDPEELFNMFFNGGFGGTRCIAFKSEQNSDMHWIQSCGDLSSARCMRRVLMLHDNHEIRVLSESLPSLWLCTSYIPQSDLSSLQIGLRTCLRQQCAPAKPRTDMRQKSNGDFRNMTDVHACRGPVFRTHFGGVPPGAWRQARQPQGPPQPVNPVTQLLHFLPVVLLLLFTFLQMPGQPVRHLRAPAHTCTPEPAPTPPARTH